MSINEPNLVNTEKIALTESDIVRLLSEVGNADKLNLKVANLPNAKLIKANLRGACLIGANLRGADLSYAQLGKAQLVGANLRGAILVKSDLREASLIGANLRGADLRDTDLRGANLFGANLIGANLQGAKLEDAILREAYVFEYEKVHLQSEGVVGLDEVTVEPDSLCHLVLSKDEPLVSVIVEKDGKEEVHYFTESAQEDRAERKSTMISPSVQEALGLAGAWDDLDWDEMEQALHRIRHESKPTPPIEL
ncbi:MAG TPA: pentapeptide repeat-containing protein [Ktedonobacteraceae bacterium]|nr:pentapeptide repeat-containing protein [Ktedonobacteraceae bacterium]